MTTYAASGRAAGGLVTVAVWRDYELLAQRIFTAGDVEVGAVGDWVDWVAETDSADPGAFVA